MPKLRRFSRGYNIAAPQPRFANWVHKYVEKVAMSGISSAKNCRLLEVSADLGDSDPNGPDC
jgi:hypothetical protein